VHDQRPVSPFEAELVDVGAERFGDPQTIECEQRTERMVQG
jgi:hypothetical protein